MNRAQTFEALAPLLGAMRHVCWVLELQPARRFVYVNAAFETLWGRSAAALQADPLVWADGIHPEDRPGVLAALEAALHDPGCATFDALYRVVHADGSQRWIEDRAGIVRDAAGAALQANGVAEDVTERKRIERLLRESRAQAGLVEDIEAFSCSVAHDLHAPLRALDGFALALAEDCGALLPASGQRQLRIIRERAQQMSRLIDDMLAFSRLSRQPLAKAPVDSAALVREALDQLEPMRQGRRIDLRVEPLPGGRGDASMLRQVWINLLSNALKYTGRCDTAVIEVGCQRVGGWKSYFVRDNGAGFDMRYVHKLFGLFERLHRSEEFEGTGIGLAIVQRIVHRHGGRVRAEGMPCHGATFSFELEG